MCGRIVLASSPDKFATVLNALPTAAAKTRQASYNVGPTSSIYAVTEEHGERILDLYHWGLIPSWAKDTSFAARAFNARAETVAEKPTFRTAFKKRRCLIPVDAFYEWRKEEGKTKKVPYVFYREALQPIIFAGLHETWESADGSVINSVTIITTEANEQIREFHHRMPLILSEEKQQRWLSFDPTDKDEVSQLLAPPEEVWLHIEETDQRVGNSRFDEPLLILLK